MTASTSTSILASTYSFLGRHVDAFAIFENALELFRRMLLENHPDIGEGRA
jgi:hypothetical protein